MHVKNCLPEQTDSHQKCFDYCGVECSSQHHHNAGKVKKDSGEFEKCESCQEMNATVANAGNAGATAASFTGSGGASST